MESLHPVVNFIYFAIVLGCSMVLMHPVCLAISFVAAFVYIGRMFGYTNARKGLLGMAGVMLLAAVMNPAFSHQGVTTLCYLPDGNALTLESIYYGMAAALMLGATLMWFRCVSEILTADKIVYLFGKPFPILSMILSMVFGFIPKMQRKLREIRYAQNIQEGKKMSVRQGIRSISLLITWALQDAVDMTDSMKCRGYGLPGRTAYTRFRFTRWDKILLSLVVISFCYMAVGVYFGGLSFAYYPVTEGTGFGFYSLSIYVAYGVICFLPVGLEGLEAYQYRKSLKKERKGTPSQKEM